MVEIPIYVAFIGPLVVFTVGMVAGEYLERRRAIEEARTEAEFSADIKAALKLEAWREQMDRDWEQLSGRPMPGQPVAWRMEAERARLRRTV